jgi:hypothetical protein
MEPGLRGQDAEANIGKADGPKGEPRDAASNPALAPQKLKKLDSGSLLSQRPE